MKKYVTIPALLFFIFSYAQEVRQWTLQEMVAYAAQNNLQVKSAEINNKLLENNIIAAQRQRLPAVNANFDNSVIIGVEGIPITNSNQQITGLTSGYQMYQNSWGVSANMNLFNRSRYQLDENKARIDLEAAEQEVLATINDISLNIVNQYLNILLNRELVQTAEEQLKIAQDQLQRNRVLYDGGAIPLSEVYESESLVAQNKQRVATSNIEVEQSKFNLAQLLQLDDYREFDVILVEMPEEPDAALIDMHSITEYAFHNQPRIKSAELAVESNKVDIDIAKTEYWPKATAFYNLGTNYRAYLNGNFDSDWLFQQWWDNHTHAVGVEINIPIFNKFLTDLNVENAQIRVQAAENQIELQKQALKQDIQAAYFLVNSTYEQYLASREAVRSAQLSFEFAEKSLKAGRITIYDFNQAANNLFSARSQMLQAKYNYLFRLKVLDFYGGKPLTFSDGINS
ncbi:MAG: TolC family protein [Flavobacteriaceae bacterium]|nr:TolC family protein [Flavobacteriaceae bacterium]